MESVLFLLAVIIGLPVVSYILSDILFNSLENIKRGRRR